VRWQSSVNGVCSTAVRSAHAIAVVQGADQRVGPEHARVERCIDASQQADDLGNWGRCPGVSSGHAHPAGRQLWVGYFPSPDCFQSSGFMVKRTVAPPSVPTVRDRCRAGDEAPYGSNFCLQTIWVGPDVCRLLADNLGCWQINVGSRPRILSVNLGRESGCLQVGAPMFAGRYT